MKNFKFLGVIFAMLFAFTGFAYPSAVSSTSLVENSESNFAPVVIEQSVEIGESYVYNVNFEETDSDCKNGDYVDLFYSKSDVGVITHLVKDKEYKMICHYKTDATGPDLLTFLKSKYEPDYPCINWHESSNLSYETSTSSGIHEKQKNYVFKQYFSPAPLWCFSNYNNKNGFKIT